MKTPIAQTVASISHSTFIGTALAASVMLSMTACSGKKSDSTHKIDTAQIMSDRNLTQEQKAEELALASEQLIAGSSAVYANDVVNIALQLDPTNVRARFWKAALGPLVQTRGLANRIAPLMHNLGKDQEYKTFVSDLRKGGVDSQDVKFLMDGPQDIATERDVQEYVAQVTNRVDQFRSTMRELRKENLEIHLNTDLKQAWNKDSQHAKCTETQSPEGYPSYECDFSKTSVIELNSADFQALEVAAAGAQIYMTVYNGWDLSGTIAYAKAHPDQSNVDVNVAAQELFANPNFGKMLKPSAFGVIPDLGKDIILGVGYAKSKQAEFCPTGDEEQVNRDGFHFEKGFCTKIDSAVSGQLVALQASLGGTAQIFDIGSGGTHSLHMVNLRNLFTKSLRDVRSNFPVQTDACKNLTSIGNSTFDGTFAAGELNQILAQSAQTNCSSN